MPSTLGRYIRHPAAGDGTSVDLFLDSRPLDGARAWIIGQNATHLAEENSLRPLASHPGFEHVWAWPRVGLLVVAPTPDEIDWSLGNTHDEGGGNMRFGPFWTWWYGDERELPTLRLAYRWTAPFFGGGTGITMAVTPGIRAPTNADDFAADYLDVVGFTDGALDVSLSPMNVQDGSVTVAPGVGVTAPADEPGGVLRQFSVWVGCCSTTNSKANEAMVLGLSLYLVAP